MEKNPQKRQCSYTKAFGELGTFKAMESTECSCGRGLQDIRHVLLHCTNQAGPRMRHLTQGSRRELDYRAY
ncbi:uncharacterized protein ASPGLDRAFT_43903, partial [Aspergillus glaucus CBS 516.65]